MTKHEKMNERFKRHNQTIISAIEEIERVLKTIKADATGGFLPRYTTHVQQHVDKMVNASSKLEELNEVIGFMHD